MAATDRLTATLRRAKPAPVHQTSGMNVFRFVVASIAALVLATGCTQEPASSGADTGPDDATSPTSAPAKPSTPGLKVSTAVDGLEHPWGIASLPGDELLFTERDRERVSILDANGKRRTVLESPAGMWHGGETGLMGIELAPDFESSHDFITCHGYRAGNTADVRVVRWHLNKQMTAAAKVRDLVKGLPSVTVRHAGCSLATSASGDLFIGTGDAAVGTNAQDLDSGGGKVLRVDAKSGKAVAGNPFADADNAMKRRIWTYGHRNVQGLAFDDGGQLWSVEHGPATDDEVNRIVKGGNYGWNPVPGYNESVPMTDEDLPGKQRAAAWSSGSPTLATSGAAFLKGEQWGPLEGELAVSALKAESLRFMHIGAAVTVDDVNNVRAFDGKYGRLRAVAAGADTLFVSTSNGSDDKILKATPR